MLTRKHFIQEAKRLKMIADDDMRSIQIEAFCQMAKANNPRFDRARFVAACTPTKRNPKPKKDRQRNQDGRLKRTLDLE